MVSQNNLDHNVSAYLYFLKLTSVYGIYLNNNAQNNIYNKYVIYLSKNIVFKMTYYEKKDKE